MSKLYNKIETLCKAHGITITTMCKSAGVSRSSLTDLKSGRSKELSAVAITKIAKYFEMSIDYFIGEENEDKESTPLNNERGAAMDFVKDLSDSDFVRYCSIIKAIFPDKFKE